MALTAHDKEAGSISDGSLFFMFPTRLSIGVLPGVRPRDRLCCLQGLLGSLFPTRKVGFHWRNNVIPIDLVHRFSLLVSRLLRSSWVPVSW